MRRLAILAFAAVAALSTGPTFAGEWFDKLTRTSNRESRSCDDWGILHRVKAGFRHQVRHVPHLPDVRIVAFNNIHEHRYLPHSRAEPIARRYCGATAALSDGRHREVWYLIEDRMGFAGVGDGVEWCVSGFDRWNVYNSYCRVLR